MSPQTKYSIILDKEAEAILVVKTSINETMSLITCKVLLTSPAVRSASEQLADEQAATDKPRATGNRLFLTRLHFEINPNPRLNFARL